MRRTAWLVLLALSAACRGTDEQQQRDDAQAAPPARADIPAFDAARAYTLLEQQVAFGPRVPGTEGHRRQLAWMTSQLREHADTLVLQSFTHTTASGRTLQLTNLFARFRPELRDRILLLAHWDTRPTADNESEPARRNQPIPGANDGASGTALLLELAAILARHAPPLGVDLLFTDGEDYATGEMYLGATYFAANLPPGYRPLYGILVDLIADQNPLFPIEGYSREYAPEVVERVWSLAHELGFGSLFPRTPSGPISDDHVPLNRAGIRTIDIIDFDYGPGNRYWHTLADDLEHTSPEGLRAVGTVLTTLIYRGG